jgi:phosphatidylglycerol:prolipoprotein diacylglycerol transferase
MEQASRGELFLHGLRLKDDFDDPAEIVGVERESAAEEAGLHPGERIASINQQPVKSAGEAKLRLMEITSEGTQIELRIAGDSQTKSWQLSRQVPRSNPIHPAQLYSAVDAFLLCLFLLAYDPYRRREGELTALLLTLHPISRFLLEIIRIDESAVFGTKMSISQNISIGILVGAVVCWIVVLSRPKALWPNQ